MSLDRFRTHMALVVTAAVTFAIAMMLGCLCWTQAAFADDEVEADTFELAVVGVDVPEELDVGDTFTVSEVFGKLGGGTYPMYALTTQVTYDLSALELVSFQADLKRSDVNTYDNVVVFNFLSKSLSGTITDSGVSLCSMTFKVLKPGTTTIAIKRVNMSNYTGMSSQPCFKTNLPLSLGLPASGHKWGEGVIEFSSDLTSAVATWTCAGNPNHVRTANCTVERVIEKQPTCFKYGYASATASAVAEGGALHAQGERSGTIDALGHSFDKRVCTRCACALGDVNRNGMLNIVDAQIAFDIATKTIKRSDQKYTESYLAYYTAADVTGDNGNPDGEVEAQDARRIQYVTHYGWDAA